MRKVKKERKCRLESMTSNKVDTPLHYEAPLADVVMVLTAMAAV